MQPFYKRSSTYFIAASAGLFVGSAYALSTNLAGRGAPWVETFASLVFWGTPAAVLAAVGVHIYMGITPRERYLRAAYRDPSVVATAVGNRELAALVQADPGFQPGPGWVTTMFPVSLTLVASPSGIELWAGRSRPTRVWWRPWNVVGPLRVDRLAVDPFTPPAWGIVLRTLVYNQWRDVEVPLGGGPLRIFAADRNRAERLTAQLESLRRTTAP
jgi:hypothetical protein